MRNENYCGIGIINELLTIEGVYWAKKRFLGKGKFYQLGSGVKKEGYW
jgi:hypothetical protein